MTFFYVKFEGGIAVEADDEEDAERFVLGVLNEAGLADMASEPLGVWVREHS